MDFRGELFNKKAEHYYMNGLREKQIREGFAVLKQQFHEMEIWANFNQSVHGEAIRGILGENDLHAFLEEVKQHFFDDTLSPESVKKLLLLIVLYVNKETREFENI